MTNMERPAPHLSGPQARRPRPMTAELPLGRDAASVRQRIEAVERLLEGAFHVPGIGRVGLDAALGLVPVIGDLAAAALGSYIVWEARNIGLPKWKLWRMAGNIAFDTALGAVPLAGDLFDVLFRSNARNLRIVKRHVDKHHPQTRVIEQ